MRVAGAQTGAHADTAISGQLIYEKSLNKDSSTALLALREIKLSMKQTAYLLLKPSTNLTEATTSNKAFTAAVC